MLSRITRFRLLAALTIVLCVGLFLGATFAPVHVQGQATGDAQSDSFVKLYQQINPSVVNIRVQFSTSGTAQVQPLDPNNPQPQTPQAAEGSGFVYDDQGHIVTNAHVVDGATLIVVTLYNDMQYVADLVGEDKDADIAVIKIDPKVLSDVKSLSLADSDKVLVGQRVIALGSPFGYSGSMSQGIVSGVHRSVESLRRDTRSQGIYSIPEVIQTDAAINPGNSGGPLLDMDGNVIGVDAQIASDSTQFSGTAQSSGVGFAIPSNIVKMEADILIKDGKVAHAMIGVSVGTLTLEINRQLNLDDNLRGAIIENVTAGSPAAKAGLKPTLFDKAGKAITTGDIIVAIDDTPVKNNSDLVSYLFLKTKPGQKVKLTVLRGGEMTDINVTLAAR
ncbi:MAG TPA: trypsin-like peptidase domain-containing protein [Aggregatilineales bacterium]|nr:trypsin-like peptidase domain-containing protein [Aggregatilineales bacterium]